MASSSTKERDRLLLDSQSVATWQICTVAYHYIIELGHVHQRGIVTKTQSTVPGNRAYLRRHNMILSIESQHSFYSEVHKLKETYLWPSTSWKFSWIEAGERNQTAQRLISKGVSSLKGHLTKHASKLLETIKGYSSALGFVPWPLLLQVLLMIMLKS